MEYLLDTNICVYVINKSSLRVLERFKATAMGEAAMSAVSYAELMFGVLNSERIAFNLARLEALQQRVPVLALSAEAAAESGRIRAALERAGTPIGSYDLLIAAHALTLGATLVTNNTREFRRIKGLKVENWAE